MDNSFHIIFITSLQALNGFVTFLVFFILNSNQAFFFIDLPFLSVKIREQRKWP